MIMKHISLILGLIAIFSTEQDVEAFRHRHRMEADAHRLNQAPQQIVPRPQIQQAAVNQDDARIRGEISAEHIGREEFKNSNLNSVELIDTREIGIGAFECSQNLTRVTIKSFNRPAIRAFAFGDCQNLETIEFFGLPGEIADNAFGEHQNNGISPEYLDTKIIIHAVRDETVHQQLLAAGIREENIVWLR